MLCTGCGQRLGLSGECVDLRAENARLRAALHAITEGATDAEPEPPAGACAGSAKVAGAGGAAA